MPRLPLQDEPESTIGRKPGRGFEHHDAGRTQVRSGAAMRREEGDESEVGGEIRDRERDEPTIVRGLEE